MGALAAGAVIALLAAALATDRARPAPGGGATAAAGARRVTAASPHSGHFEYVFPDGAMYVYDIDHHQRLVERVALPQAVGIRGVAASPRTHLLYVSYGGFGGSTGTGSLLAYDLLAGRVIWTKHYATGVDSMAIGRDGRRIYMPTGEADPSGNWNVLDARSGEIVAVIRAGAAAHNTVVGLSGRHVYLGGRGFRYLEVASTASNRITKQIGPLRAGVRPFTINGRESLAYTTATGFAGFQVSSITTGRVLYTATFKGFAAVPGVDAPSHGISLSPDEREIWVMDEPNGYLHVFDVAGLPRTAPRRLADIKLSATVRCPPDCARSGWIQHSRDGRFVYVGDRGDVIDTRTFRAIAHLAPLARTKKSLEIDWRAGLPVFTTSRSGLGYVTGRRAAHAGPALARSDPAPRR